MSQLIDDMLALSQVTRGEFERAPVDLSAHRPVGRRRAGARRAGARRSTSSWPTDWPPKATPG